MEQWENVMEAFLTIDDEPPDYETPTGRKKQRKSVIGRLQGVLLYGADPYLKKIIDWSEVNA